ncbi:biotin--[acetyl-CoA-carboxylase] ligase [Jiangella alba]|uniref:biotin--[biotin carboxyl-carrier protein] ligase n=1 Tax=Jiangella alba TaxID=561176 RepID=A0A1H5GVR3_9ACTN|nr:biotin--[acetyl-CoA-carboxylase] ligase [Jiangella alba]SEE19561.1 BirA family transcriptional regulator, biotin operon repressor / biotin-[acetyl-CoA-carboxylase] ligase [Jiangella alba]
MWDVHRVATTGSTNADVAAAARSGAAEGHAVVAEHQSAGRGRLDRRWEAPPGTSLAMSFLLRPHGVPDLRWSWLPLLAGVVVVDAVDAAAGAVAVLKWPNDVLLDGGKLSGILVERVETPSGAAAVVGIGLNVAQTPGQLPPGGVSLAPYGARADAVLDAVASGLAARYETWRAAGGDPSASGLAEAYSARCDTLGREVRAELPGGDTVEGRATAVDAAGRLLIAPSAGGDVVAIGAGDVVHLRPR